MGGGVALRIAAAAILVAGVALLILAAGVIVVGSQTFANLMASHGISTASSDAMFQGSVVQVVLVAASVAVVAAIALAAVIAARLVMPLREIGAAARRIAEGRYESRIERRGPEEIVSLADSFNQMAASLEEQERMRREFIANAAHELRTPLTNLKGYLEALRDGVIPPDRATFESLWEETERLVRLSRGLDTLADGDAAGPPAPVDVDLALVIRSAVELIQPAARASGLEITLAVPARLPAHGNPDQLAQVLGNLLQNAVRYSTPGGQVGIRAERRPADILVSVTTSGNGIPADALPHVFERFYRVEKSRDRERGGAGIGLSIVKQLVEGHGGNVGAESAGGVTRVWFSLPGRDPLRSAGSGVSKVRAASTSAGLNSQSPGRRRHIRRSRS
jgi:signal transduction histidine kinase